MLPTSQARLDKVIGAVCEIGQFKSEICPNGALTAEY